MNAYTHKFKTIDEFIDKLTTFLHHQHDKNNVCSYAVQSHSDVILSVLKSSTNKPSKYDLMILNNVHIEESKNIDFLQRQLTAAIGVPNDLMYGSKTTDYLKEILEIYKSRK